MVAGAATVDLSGWTENGFKGNNGAGTWTVQGADNDTVFQSINGLPTVFFEPGANDRGKALTGTITVETTSDDDFVGFVLGYQDGELGSTNADFWLIDWKQATQSYAGIAPAGLALSHVTGDLTGSGEVDFWSHTGVVEEVLRATTYGNVGYVDNQTYTFDLEFTSSLIAVSVNGETVLSYAGSFENGSFGFYNYSQQNVRYAGITEDVAPSAVPVPASLPLILAGLGSFALVRRNRRK
ncbi:VPLPA-CTERM sorting domain-containing protein [Tropicimonas sp. IMCC34043]|uniref:VPLPA-CTERM sorting domain-containing protein n=1 Tax=Tropicimonas sp. IMCC34043 TaxID=2248760 RepID=UPI0013002E15|nr:VPLPA-CTERM sorting domain-containing protein [Tropicimonas sp. IMCC34043]